MKRTLVFLFAVICIVTFAANVSASEDEHKSGKGDDDHGGSKPVAGMDWQAGDKPIPRTFVHQPPLVPHAVDEYEITTSENDCLECHGEPDSGAPALHPSHYLDRDGKKTDKIAAQWYFCNQCHVGQADAKPFVENTFQAK
jgi:nitrate reductase cytochrome c-type subunit